MNLGLSKDLLNLGTFVSGAVFAILTYIYRQPLLFGFMLLFTIMFIVDSFWFFLKKKVLKNGMQPIGVFK